MAKPEPRQEQFREPGWYVIWSNQFKTPRLYYWDGKVWKKDPSHIYGESNIADNYISGYVVGQRISKP